MRLSEKNTQKMTHGDRYHACALSFDDMDALCSSRAEEKKTHQRVLNKNNIYHCRWPYASREASSRERRMREREKQLRNDREQG